jgi:drug/metabolite transporter (DMT)-like permease
MSGQVGRVNTARWAVGALFALVGILWIVTNVIGTVNYAFLTIGIVWLLGSVGWPLGILTQRRCEQVAAIKDQERV